MLPGKPRVRTGRGTNEPLEMQFSVSKSFMCYKKYSFFFVFISKIIPLFRLLLRVLTSFCRYAVFLSQ